MEDREISSSKKIDTFLTLFKGRLDAFGTGAGLCIKKELSDAVLLRHLQGKRRIGMYPLSPDILDGSGVYWACVDIDVEDFNLALAVATVLDMLGIFNNYIERSKSKGYHIWVFFSEPVEAIKARSLMKFAGQENEVFPKQDKIVSGVYGNYVNLPLFGADIANGKTVFIDEIGKPYPDQWAFLESIEKVSKGHIDSLFESGKLELNTSKAGIKPALQSDYAMKKVQSEQTEVRLRNEYHFDSSGFYAYILLNCNKEIFNLIKTHLNIGELNFSHAGRSYHPADNGRQYHWFIRIHDSKGNKPSAKTVANFFKQLQQIKLYEKPSESLDDLERKNRQLENEIRGYKSLIQENEALKMQIQKYYEDIQKQLNSHKNSVEDAKTYEQMALENQAENIELRKTIQDLRLENKALNEEAQNKNEENKKIRLKQQNRLSTKDSLEKMIQCLLPRVELLRGSFDILSTELQNTEPVLKSLHKICYDPQSLKAEHIKSIEKPWKRIHFSTGQDDHGRIYFLHEDSNWKVLISYRKDQKKDIEYIKTL